MTRSIQIVLLKTECLDKIESTGLSGLTLAERNRMSAAEARIPTENAGRYLARLCQHAGQMGTHLGRRPGRHPGGGAPPEILRAESSDDRGTLVLNWGRCTLQAGDGMLTLRAEAGDPDSLARIQELIAGRLEKFGRRERLIVTWQPATASPASPA
jgi:hypothetical protein